MPHKDPIVLTCPKQFTMPKSASTEHAVNEALEEVYGPDSPSITSFISTNPSINGNILKISRCPRAAYTVMLNLWFGVPQYLNSFWFDSGTEIDRLRMIVLVPSPIFGYFTPISSPNILLSAILVNTSVSSVLNTSVSASNDYIRFLKSTFKPTLACWRRL